MNARIFYVVLPLLALSPGAGAEERIRIYDTHVHYSKTAWSQFSTRAALEALTRAGVTDALVSSTPDDGTLQLFRADRRRIRPVLRPYRTREDMGDWFRNDAVIDYVAERLRSGFYVGIGEFHLFDPAAAETPQMRRLIDLALEHKVMLHVHSGAEPVRRLAAIEPRVQILWAHAGLTEPASVVAALLAEDPDLLTEVSFRAGDIMAGDTIDPGRIPRQSRGPPALAGRPARSGTPGDRLRKRRPDFRQRQLTFQLWLMGPPGVASRRDSRCAMYVMLPTMTAPPSQV